MIRRVLYLDPGLYNDIGHHANYCRYIVGELRGRGVPTAVLAHRQILPALASELGAEPFFRAYPYLKVDHDPISGWLHDYEQARHVTREDLTRLTGVDADMLVFMSSVQPAQLAAASHWHASLPLAQQPLLVLEASESGLIASRTASGISYAAPDPPDEPRPTLFRSAAARMPAGGAARRSLIAFDNATADALAHLFLQPVATLPLPYPAIVRPRARSRSPGPTRVSVLGHQRDAKGLAMLPALARELLRRAPDLRLYVQTVDAVGAEEAMVALEALAVADPRLILDRRVAGRTLWAQHLDRSDLLLCPYDPAPYVASFSSVAAEALANGIPLVVPGGTTLETMLRAFGEPGTIFPSFEVASIVDATLRALEDYDRIAERARAAAIAWPSRQGPARTIDALLALGAPSSREGQVPTATPPSPLRNEAGGPRSIRHEWEWVPEGWRDGDPRGAGWCHPSVIATQRQRWPVYSALIRGKGPLGFHLFAKGPIRENDQSAHNAFMSFAYVLTRAAHGKSRLSILDWGGGVGYYALIAEALLPEIALDYVVKEIPDFVALGRELMPSVRFESDADACFARRYDLVLASSSLQYSQDWIGVLSRLAAAAQPWLFLSRLPVVRRGDSFAVVQRPHEYGYDTEYISWVLSRDAVLAEAARLGLTLEREFLTGGTTRHQNAPEDTETLGFLFRATAPLDPEDTRTHDRA